MGFQQSNQTLLKLNSGVLWQFWHTRNKGIQYRILNEDQEWSAEQSLAPEAMEDFSAGVDDKDHIHLIYQTKKGELRYMRYNGTRWSSQVLSSFEPTKHIIRYPTILAASQKIHVIFAMGTAFNVGLWSLFHYYWNGNAWSQYEICRFTGGKHIGSFQIDTYEGDIHLCYRGMDEHHFQIYYTRFTEDYSIWSTPENISNSREDCAYPSLLVDDEGNIHFCWSALADANMHVYYCKKSLFSLRASFRKAEKISDGFSNCIYPILSIANRRLWVLWVQNNQIRGSSWHKERNHWGSTEMIHEIGNRNIYLYRYLSNKEDETNRLKTLYLFADGDPLFHIALPDPDIHISPHRKTASYTYDYGTNDRMNSSFEAEEANPADDLSSKTEPSAEAEMRRMEKQEEEISDQELFSRSTRSSGNHHDMEKPQTSVQKDSAEVYDRNRSQYLSELLQDIEGLGVLRKKLQELLREMEQQENRLYSYDSLERRFNEMESVLYTLQRETEESLNRVYQSEAELQQLAASLRNFEGELMDLQLAFNQYREKKLLQRILSSLKIK
ncbi:MAG: hypothetical protein ACOX6S_02710 [Clostridia bacterium]|jgi:hypothetical protein